MTESDKELFLGMGLEMWRHILIPLVLLILSGIGKIIYDLYTRKMDAAGIIPDNHNEEELDFSFDKEESKEDVPEEYSDKVDNLANKYLEQVRKSLNADRAWAGKLHNGTENSVYNGRICWQLFSIIISRQAAGVSDIKDNFHHLPVVLYRPILDRILEKGFFYTENIHNLPLPLYYLLKNQGTSSVCMIGLFDDDRKLRGMAGVEKTRGELDIEQAQLDLFTDAGGMMTDFLRLYKVKK